MATCARYFDLVREMKDTCNHRLRLVESATQRGIKPTSRLFATTVPTVRKWLRRYQRRGLSGLVALSRARHSQPQKLHPKYKEALFRILHTPPRNFAFNRTTWRQKDLAIVMTRQGLPIGKNRVCAFIR